MTELTIFSFILDGNPIPLARHRHGNGRTWDSQKQAKVAIGLQLVNQFKHEPLTGPLKLDVTFFLPPPQKNKKIINTYHHYRPDLDNLIKMICDSANKILYKDDSQISVLNAQKKYSLKPRTELAISNINQ